MLIERLPSISNTNRGLRRGRRNHLGASGSPERDASLAPAYYARVSTDVARLQDAPDDQPATPDPVEARSLRVDVVAFSGTPEAARIVRREGAKQIVIAVSHAVFCGPAVERLDNAPADKILVTDTIPRREKMPRQVEIISIAALFGRAILNIHRAESVSSLFEELA